ncbi:hypothetical protein G6F43_007293 [Rhizopus delemar]|nr:hypothetical protein G6F43_007293 [Rhizopus delemar]
MMSTEGEKYLQSQYIARSNRILYTSIHKRQNERTYRLGNKIEAFSRSFYSFCFEEGMSNEDHLEQVKEIEQLLSNFEALDIIEQLKHLQRQVDQRALEYQERQTEHIERLENELETLKTIEEEVAQEYYELVQRNETLNKEEQELEQYVEQQAVDIEGVKQEIQMLEKELEEVEEDQLIGTSTAYTEIVNALFHGLGVKAIIEENKVTKVQLDSFDKEQTCILDVTKYSDTFKTNYIWKYISKGLL